jgi:hypothetical protein
MFFNHTRSHNFARAVAVTVGLMLSHAASAQVPVLQPSQQLRPPIDPTPGGLPGAQVQFGWLAATDGQTTIVTVNHGHAAYAYTKDAQGRWRFRDALVAPDGYTSYGAAVLGNTGLVEGVADSQNVVFVFKRSFGQWSHTQTLPANQPSTLNHLALGSDYAAIADSVANDVAGALYLYDKVGAGTYSLGAVLTPAGATEGWFSGYSITGEGNTILSTAPGEYVTSVWVRSGGVWSEQTRLSLPSAMGFDVRTGYSADRALLASSSRGIESPNNPVVFHRQNGTWSVEQTLVHPSDPDKGLRSPLALKGNLLVVREDGIAGEAHLFVYELVSGAWIAKAELSEPVCGDASSTITSQVTIGGRTVFVTCPTAVTPRPHFDGRVFVYEVP